MRSLKISVIVSLLLLLVVLVGCNRPEYYNPYGDGVDPETVVTEGFQSRVTQSQTALRIATTSSTAKEITTTTKLVIPPGYIRCPDCNGERVVCPYCKGTDKRPAEVLDVDSGIYKRYFENCLMCSAEDPGYYLCETCGNQLYIAQ